MSYTMMSANALAFLLVLYVVYRRFQRRISISHVRGPSSSSWLYGNWIEFLEAPAGEADFRWNRQFGGIVRVKAPLGEDRLIITDPKAIQYVYHTASYRFPKPTGRSVIIRSLLGSGLTVMDGDDHRRGRKVMLPGFGGPAARSFVPIFSRAAGKLAQIWQGLIASDAQQMTVVSIPWWISRASLDAIGEAAFDYQFEALDNTLTDNTLADLYSNLFFDVFGLPTKSSILGLGIVDEIPLAIVNFMLRNFPPRRMVHLFETNKLSTSIAQRLVEDKTAVLLEGGKSRSILSLLVKAKHSPTKETALDEKEVLAQINTIILAGHKTTANTLTFAFFELCKQPEIQKRLRAEIRTMGKTSDYTSSDFDKTPYLTAVVKETLRVHPILYNTFRIAGGDEVLPLLDPITLDTGEVVTELPIPKGTKIITSIAAYNRNKAIFGEDADVFNPDRWLRAIPPQSKVSLGVYGNLFTFVGGARSCIGWRFAVLEMHAFLVELVGKFEFEFISSASVNDFRREASQLMTPTIESEREKGSQLSLRIRAACNEA